MSAMSNILLKKDDGTDNTYYPASDRPNPNWRTNVSGIGEAGQSRLEIQTEKMKNGKTRANIKVTQPLMAVIPSGSVNAMGVQAGPTVVDEESISMTAYLSPHGTNETRADLVRQFAHLIGGASATTATTAAPQAVTADSYRDIGSDKALVFGLINLLWPGV